MQDSLAEGLAEGSLPIGMDVPGMAAAQNLPVNPAFAATHIKRVEPDELDAFDDVADDPMPSPSAEESDAQPKKKGRGKAKGKAKGKARG